MVVEQLGELSQLVGTADESGHVCGQLRRNGSSVRRGSAGGARRGLVCGLLVGAVERGPAEPVPFGAGKHERVGQQSYRSRPGAGGLAGFEVTDGAHAHARFGCQVFLRHT
ncbi:hypothetical protein GCM10027610_091740 [Dactylosporangium cerinum]